MWWERLKTFTESSWTIPSASSARRTWRTSTRPPGRATVSPWAASAARRACAALSSISGLGRAAGTRPFWRGPTARDASGTGELDDQGAAGGEGPGGGDEGDRRFRLRLFGRLDPEGDGPRMTGLDRRDPLPGRYRPHLESARQLQA